jgi:hypothetical protein
MHPLQQQQQQLLRQSLRARYTWRRCDAEAKPLPGAAPMLPGAVPCQAAALQPHAAHAVAVHACVQRRRRYAAKKRGARRFASPNSLMHRSGPAVRPRPQQQQRRKQQRQQQNSIKHRHHRLPQRPAAPFVGNAERMARPSSFAPGLLPILDYFFGTNHPEQMHGLEELDGLFAAAEPQQQHPAESPSLSTSSSFTAAPATEDVDYFSSNHTQARRLDDDADGLFQEVQQQEVAAPPPSTPSASARR